MKVVHLASEAAPFSKTGGLADVVGSLPPALARAGLEVAVISPAYRSVTASGTRRATRLRVRLDGRGRDVTVLEVEERGVRWLFVEEPGLFDRDGLYGPPGADYPDNAERFALFCRAALAALPALDLAPDVVHCHDWQTGPACLLLRDARRRGILPSPGSVFTIHNLGYQGNFPRAAYDLFGLGAEYFAPDWAEYYGQVSFLKAGLAAADRLTTVSPTYAREIQEAELGFGMDPVLRHRSDVLSGIINGIDTGYWDPSADPNLPAGYFSYDTAGKSLCKSKLFEELGLRDTSRPLFGCVSRLADQKGIDLITGSIAALVEKGARFCLLGTGAPEYHRALAELQQRFPGSVAAVLRFDEPLAHRVYAGSDFFLMPSRYEPCGLGQMIALRYGTLPVAARTGGLADTVVDLDEHPRKGNGFLCERGSARSFRERLERAVTLFGGARVERAVRRGMTTDFSWEARAGDYVRLYQGIAGC